MQQWWSKGTSEADLAALGLDLSDRRLMTCLSLVKELRDFPRHLSQHVGGIVITKDRLDDVVPIQNAAMEDRTVVEWNKDDLQVLENPESRHAGARHADLHPQGVRHDRADLSAVGRQGAKS